MENKTLEEALFTIRKLKSLVQTQKAKNEPIAIIGIGCRFPLANSKDEFWQLLLNKKNVITKMPESRWELLKNTNENILKDNQHPYWGGYLSDISSFDAYFFGITPREALRMDPQQRLLLEVVYEAIEDSGTTMNHLNGSNTGVFSSLYASQFGHMQSLENDQDALYLPTGNAISMAANRISYLFNLQGPSIVLDTACSSSLVAIDLACLHLQNALCNLAIVCGANINLSPSINNILSKAKMLSADGQCKTFDKDANGYVQGEGVGAILLKPLSAAIKDHDRIYAVIAGFSVNQDGKTNGLTAPNGRQQETLLKKVCNIANVNPHDISYLECHGTGTFLGDPIELQAIGEIVGKDREPQKPCWLGSVKTNLGHLEPAAGIASVIKVALALKHKLIPPHLNFVTPNPYCPFDQYALKIPLKTEEWPCYGPYRVAGVSSFGFGGTNAHLIMRELSDAEQPQITQHQTHNQEIFTLSAKDSHSLNQLIQQWNVFITNNPSLDLAAICYNTHVKRNHYPYRLAIIAENLAELHQSLKNSQNYAFINNTPSENQSESINDFTNLTIQELAKLYVSNKNINWDKYENDRKYSLIDMPLYPWNRKNYWPEMRIIDQNISNHLFKARSLNSPLDLLQFEFTFNTKDIPEIQDTYHFLHAGYYLEMLNFAIAELKAGNTYTIKNLHFNKPILVPEKMIVTVQLILQKNSAGNFDFNFYSQKDPKNWISHANGELKFENKINKQKFNLREIKNRCTLALTQEKFYQRIREMQMPTEGSICWTHQAWRGIDEILCEFLAPKTINTIQNFYLKMHFGVIDGAIQTLFLTLAESIKNPYVASKIRLINSLDNQYENLFLWAKLKILTQDEREFLGDWYLINEKGEVILECQDLCMTQLGGQRQNEIKEQPILNQLLFLSADKKHQAIMDFLINEVATIFSMPKTAINIDCSLQNMGMDSLMALTLMRTIGTDTDINLQTASIREIADILSQKNEPMKNPYNPWIPYQEVLPAAKIKLICFPYGGGGASIYRDWQQYLPGSVQICPIQLPGREERMEEPHISEMTNLIDQLINNLQDEFTSSFAFFGHSFGALIAFELTRALRKRGMSTPIHIFASAFPDPRYPTKSLDQLLLQLKTIDITLENLLNKSSLDLLSTHQLQHLSEIFNSNGIVNYGNHLTNRESIKYLLPLFAGDMSIVKSYQFYEDTPLDCSLTIFSGTQDFWVNVNEQSSWSEHTSKQFFTHKFNSGHLFIRDEPIKKAVLQIIQKTLLAE